MVLGNLRAGNDQHVVLPAGPLGFRLDVGEVIRQRIASRCNGSGAAGSRRGKLDASVGRRQCDVFSSGSSRTYQLSQSVVEPPPIVTVKASFSAGISQRLR